MACVNNELRVLQDDWDLRATVHQFLHKRDMLRTSSAQPMTTAVPSTAWPDYHGAGRAQDVDISTTGFNWVPPSSSVHTTCAVDNMEWQCSIAEGCALDWSAFIWDLVGVPFFIGDLLQDQFSQRRKV